MAAQPDLTIHDMKVTQQIRFTPGGDTARVTSVTYFVGSHGPFTDDYAAADATAENIRAGMEKQVAVLRGLALMDVQPGVPM